LVSTLSPSISTSRVSRAICTLRDLDYEIDLDLGEVRDRPDILFPKLHELLGKRERLLDVLWEEEKWNLMQVVVTGTDRLHHFLFDAYDDPTHPHHGAFLDYYRAVDAFVGASTTFRGRERRVLRPSDHVLPHAAKSALTRLASTGLAFAPDAAIDAISGRRVRARPARIYRKRGKYPRGGGTRGKQRSSRIALFAALTRQ
jgi:hypothetical protein